jgi:DNA polymerase-3 subunit epsilon
MPYLAGIDVETTGLNPYRHDRVIELAALITGLNGETIREFVTLINPERDIGPTSIHGLTQSDIILAPRFAEIAGPFLDMLDGCVLLAGHNIRFDHSFLSAEFERLGSTLPNGTTMCTMTLAGGGLSRPAATITVFHSMGINTQLSMTHVLPQNYWLQFSEMRRESHRKS